MALTELLGENVLNKDGVELSVKSIEQGDLVGLYFSAHWCPPCRGFTPDLATFYKDVTTSGEKIEIVFISSDRSQDDFNGYLSEMPWYAIPFADRDRKKTLAEKYEVTGIPTLIILNAKTGEIIDKQGRSSVANSDGKLPAAWKK